MTWITPNEPNEVPTQSWSPPSDSTAGNAPLAPSNGASQSNGASRPHPTGEPQDISHPYGSPPFNPYQPYGGGPPLPQPGYQRVQPRNPVLYALASFLVAGLGTGLGGNFVRAIAIFCAVVFLGLTTLIPFIGLLMVPLWLGAWAFSIYDGFMTAQRWNARHGILS